MEAAEAARGREEAAVWRARVGYGGGKSVRSLFAGRRSVRRR